MLDYSKITFDSLEKNGPPWRAFYIYDLDQDQNKIADFLKEYAGVEEMPDDIYIYRVTLCLSIYTADKDTMEFSAFCTDPYGEEYWFKLHYYSACANELINLIPDFEFEDFDFEIEQ